MIKNSKVLYAPQTEPVTNTEVKAQAYITSSDRDTVITDLIKVARSMCERYAGMSFMTQTRVVKLDAFPSCRTEIIQLPYGPVLAINGSDTATPANTLGITYIDEDGESHSLAVTTDFLLDSHSDIPRLSPVDDWPTDVSTTRIHPVTITYTAGHASAAAVPPEAKQAIIMQAIFLHENPDAMELCAGAMAMLDLIKVYYNAWQD